MEIIIPQFGLFFWSLVIFLTFFFILRKMAWKPILSMIHEREDSIEQSLAQATKAREEIAALKAEIDGAKQDAEKERTRIIAEANQTRDEIVQKARKQAEEVAAREADKARQQIQAQKMAAVTEMKNEAGKLAIDIAERLLRKEFSNKAQQQSTVKQLVSELSQN